MAVKKLEAFQFGWSIAKSNIPFFFGAHLIALGIFALSHLLSSGFEMASSTIKNPLLNGAVSIVDFLLGILLFTAPIMAGLTKINIDFYDGKKAYDGDLLCGYSSAIFFKHFVASVLFNLAVIIGTIFFIIPGIVFLFKFAFATNFVVDKKCDALEALKKSSDLTNGIKRDLFYFCLLALLLNLAPPFLGGLSLSILSAILPGEILSVAISAIITLGGLSLTLSTTNVAWDSIYRTFVPKNDPDSEASVEAEDDLKMAS